MPSFAKDLRHISKVDKIWRLVDAKGKHKPYYDRSVLCGDPVVVINARYVELTGRKWKTRVYKKHSGRNQRN
ncbi:50S ribosomal protein L13 [Galdieria sulphuraria]|nr:50S ribosomal protein L13 [Galdieria sulphuraria]